MGHLVASCFRFIVEPPVKIVPLAQLLRFRLLGRHRLAFGDQLPEPARCSEFKLCLKAFSLLQAPLARFEYFGCSDAGPQVKI